MATAPGAEFTAALNSIKAKPLTVVLDCCHAGGIGEPRDVEPAGGTGGALGRLPQ